MFSTLSCFVFLLLEYNENTSEEAAILKCQIVFLKLLQCVDVMCQYNVSEKIKFPGD